LFHIKVTYTKKVYICGWNVKYKQNHFVNIVKSHEVIDQIVIHCLMTGILSEKCVFRQFRHHANVIECNTI